VTDRPSRPALAGLLGPGAHYVGSLVFQGKVRVDGTLNGGLRTDDLLEVGPDGRIDGEVEVAQALIAGTIEGVLRAKERVTLLETAVIRGRVITPWLDMRLGARVKGEVVVERGGKP
jgi:cytoskeletal protein CcmA (bactofilin family)